jgi:phosphoglycolate phosphatase
MRTPLRLVMFDVDGTLIDSQDSIIEAMVSAFSAMGEPLPPRHEVLAVVGLSLDRALERLLPGSGAGRVDEAVALYKEAFLKQREHKGAEAASALYPGTRETLAALQLRDEVLLGLATGKARRGLDHATAAHGLDPFFVTRQTADRHPSKPHPSMLLAALAETGADVAGAVMVGDTTFDIEMGQAAGFRTIGVSWGYHGAEALRAAGADRLIGGFAGLIPALEEIWGETA